ncbi:MAG: hemolysin III family protein [Actinomycetota bacterium]
MQTTISTAEPSPQKPLLRGWSHAVSFPIWVLVGTALLIVARVGLTGHLLLGVYVVGTGAMFLASAMYHRGRWTPKVKLRMQKVDRTAIFLAIAGGYTPIAAAALGSWTLVAVLVAAWVGAAVGMALQWIPTVHRALRGASYMVVSWMAVFTFPQLYHGLGATGFWLIVAGGICYTVGAIALATRWPDPWPKVFGFHEVFHAFTVVAATLVFIAIVSAVAPKLA